MDLNLLPLSRVWVPEPEQRLWRCDLGIRPLCALLAGFSVLRLPL